MLYSPLPSEGSLPQSWHKKESPMFLKNVFKFITIATLVSSQISFGEAAKKARAAKKPEIAAKKAELAAKTTAEENIEAAVNRVDASLPSAQTEAIRVLLLASILATKDYFPDVVRVPDEIREKYEVFRSTMTGGGPVVGGLGVALVKVSYKSLKEAEFTEAALNRLLAVLRPSAESAKNSWARFWNMKFMTALGRVSSKSFDSSYQRLQPVINLVFKRGKGSGYALGASAISGALYGSIYLARHNSREIMGNEMARSILGYDEAFDQKLNAVVSKTAAVYSLEPFKQALLRNGIRRELMDLALRNDFRIEDEQGNPIQYSIDIIKIMLEQNLIDLEVAEAAERWGKVVNQAWGADSSRTTLEALDGSITMVLQVSALLEAMVTTEELPEAVEKEVRLRLAHAQRTIMRLQSNLKN
jgi:hypothetical protein